MYINSFSNLILLTLFYIVINLVARMVKYFTTSELYYWLQYISIKPTLRKLRVKYKLRYSSRYILMYA